MVYMNSAEGFHFVCGDIVISRDQYIYRMFNWTGER